MERDCSIKQYYPKTMQDIREFEEYAKAIDPEIQDLWARKEQVFSNLFIPTCDEKGIARYERLFRLQPPATASLEERRLEVFLAWNAQIPFTETRLVEMLNILCGEGMYTLKIERKDYYVEVIVALARKTAKNPVDNMLDKVLPSNMLYLVDLQYNTYGNLKRYIYGQLHGRTYRQLREEELPRTY